MEYLMSFIVGGILCVIGQIIIDIFKKNNAYLLVSYVVIGVILGYFGIYDKLVEIGHSGATVTLIGFGNSLAKGAMEEASINGFMGALSGGVKSSAAGVATVIIVGYIVSIIFEPKSDK